MKRAFTSFLNHLQNVNELRGARKQTVGCPTDVLLDERADDTAVSQYLYSCIMHDHAPRAAAAPPCMHEAAASYKLLHGMRMLAARACMVAAGSIRTSTDVKRHSNVSTMEVRKDHLLVGVGGRSLRHCA